MADAPKGPTPAEQEFALLRAAAVSHLLARKRQLRMERAILERAGPRLKEIAEAEGAIAKYFEEHGGEPPGLDNVLERDAKRAAEVARLAGSLPGGGAGTATPMHSPEEQLASSNAAQAASDRARGLAAVVDSKDLPQPPPQVVEVEIGTGATL